MNRIIIFLTVAIFLAGCSSFEKREPSEKEPGFTVLEEHEKDHLYYYSRGLHKSNLAAEADRYDERETYLSSAIELFEKAVEFNIEKGRIYNQISACYLDKGDIENSLYYADKSITEDRTDIEPYSRKYAILSSQEKNDEAAEVLTSYLEVDTDDAYVNYVLGEHYLRYNDDMSAARDSFEKVIYLADKNPADRQFKEHAYYHLGYIAFNTADIEEAVLRFEQVMDENPDNVNAIYTLALLYAEMKRLDRAEHYSRLFLSIDGDNETVHALMGRILYIKDEREALTHLRKGFNGDMLESLFSRALYYELIGKDPESIQIVPSLIRMNQHLVSPRIAAARIAQRNGEYEDAHREFFNAGLILFNSEQYELSGYYIRQALEIKQTPQTIFQLARVYEETGNPALAIYYYKKLNKINPDSGTTLQIALIYGFRENFDEAHAYIDRVIEEEPENEQAYFSRAIVYIHQDKNDSAEEALKKTISLDDRNDLYYFYLAVVYERTDRPDEAVEALKMSLEFNPENPKALNFLGYLYADENRNLDEAYDLILKALEYDPDNGAYVDSLGWVYFRKGDYNKALEKLLRAEKLLENENRMDPAVYDHIGDTYQKLGNRIKAVQYWKKALELDGNGKVQEKIDEK